MLEFSIEDNSMKTKLNAFYNSFDQNSDNLKKCIDNLKEFVLRINEITHSLLGQEMGYGQI